MQANHPSIDVCMVFTNTNMFYKYAVEFGLGCALITDVDQFWYGMVWYAAIGLGYSDYNGPNLQARSALYLPAYLTDTGSFIRQQGV